MSLITEEKRETLRNSRIEKLIGLIKKRRIKKKRPKINDEYALFLAQNAKTGLTKSYFYVLADLGKSVDEKAEELEKSSRTINGLRHCLLALGAIKPYGKKYTKDDFVKSDQRFPSRTSLRKAIDQYIKKGEELTIGEISDRLKIPKFWTSTAKENYGVSYQAYSRLADLLGYEARRGERVSKVEVDRKCRYKFLGNMSLDSPALRNEKHLEIINKMGPCTVKEIQEEFQITRWTVRTYIKRWEKTDKIKRIRPPKNYKGLYDFFSKAFPHKSYLIFNPKNQEHLERLSEKLITCVPEIVHPWMEEHLYNQLDELEENGLPKEIYIRMLYVLDEHYTSL